LDNNLKIFNKDLPNDPLSKISSSSGSKNEKTESESKKILKLLLDYQKSIEEKFKVINESFKLINESLKEINGRIFILENQKNKDNKMI